MAASRLARVMHRAHRLTGSVLSLLMLAWFVSGGVMTFSGYPRVSDAERLASAPPLPHHAAVRVPPALLAALREPGARVRLAMHEGAPTWLFSDARGERTALRAQPPYAVDRLTVARARAEIARRTDLKIADIALLTESDQWTVALGRPGTLPFYRVRFDDPDGREVYLSARTGEIVQDSLRSERALAWLGAIPHWIYPTVLRRESALWRQVVLALSAVGLVLTLSGVIAGWHVYRATRRRKAPRDPYLRWHQALGLSFGLLANTWLFSGALSLNPFRWSDDGQPRQIASTAAMPEALPLDAALQRCQQTLAVRELELAALGEGLFAVCTGQDQQTQLVDLGDPDLTPRAGLADARAEALARQVAAGSAYTLEVAHAYDAYHYPTHTAPYAALPYLRIAVADDAASTYYVDPARAKLIRRHTRRTRLERWLYHGLHSLDLPGLYAHRVVWRTLVIGAMGVGSTLSALGFAMQVRRWRRAQKSRARKRAAATMPNA